MSSSNSSAVYNVSLSGQLSFYAGINLADILYGVEVYIYFKTMQIFLARRKTRRKSDIFYALFSSVMFLLITAWLALIEKAGQAQWVVDQNHPPRVIPFATFNFTSAVTIILQLMTDGLMMYRCWIVWDSHRAIIIPFILWLASSVLGILVVWATSTSRTSFFQGEAAKLSLAYFSVSVCLTATMTCMICGRLVHYARMMKKSLGQEYAAPYFSVIVLLVESVLPYSIIGIALLVSIVTGLVAQTIIVLLYGVMMCVSPQMLILRVAEGSAWQRETIKPLQSVTLKFSPGSGDTSSSGHLGGTGTVIHLESLPGVPPVTQESGMDDKV